MLLLSFDIEEFDGPREHGVEYSLEEGMKVSIEGTNRIFDMLAKNDVRATFFTTGNFDSNAPEVMKRIINDGHEWHVTVLITSLQRKVTFAYQKRLSRRSVVLR